MKKILIIVGVLIVVGILLFFLLKKSPSKVNDFESYIQDYHKSYFDGFPGNNVNTSIDQPKAYLDFSDGMYFAFEPGSPNYNMINAIAKSTIRTDCEWHGLGVKTYPTMEKIKTTSLAEFVTNIKDKESYTDIYAQIDGAIKNIVNSNADALLITDFELVTEVKGLPNYNPTFTYALDHFIDWINKGNAITIFYNKSTFVDNKAAKGANQSKRIFYIAFTKGALNDNSLANRLQKEFDNDVNVKNNYERYDLCPKPYSIKTEYGGKDKTGIADVKALTQSAKMIFQDDKMAFEAIEFNQPWEKLDRYFQQEIISKNESILRKLYLDASNNDAFKLKSVKVVVTDVSENFQKFSKVAQAKSLESSIKMERNSKTGDSVWTEDTKKNKSIVELFTTNTRQIKPEFQFNEPEGNKIEEILDINSLVFDNDIKKNNGEKIELQTIFNKNYKKEKLTSNSKPFIIRIDYLIDKTEPNSSNAKLINMHPQLKVSIENLLNDNKSKPEIINPLIYSYYLKFPSVK